MMKDLLSGRTESAEQNLYSSPLRLMNNKLEESLAPAHPATTSVYKSIKENGFQGHVTMGHRDFSGDETPAPTITEGHHSLAAASDIQAATGKTQWVGIDWEEDTPGRFNHRDTFKSYNERYPQNPGNAREWTPPS